MAPIPIESLPTIDAHPIVRQAWQEQRPEDEIQAARAEAERLEAAWAALAALLPGAATDGEITQCLASIERTLRAVYARSPSRLILGWFMQDMHALIAEAQRLLGDEQHVVHLPWRPL
jgi:hypothetical protein